MKYLFVVLAGMLCAVTNGFAADAPLSSALAAQPNEADSMWLEIQSSGSSQQMQWKGEKAPTAEEVEAHKGRVARQLLKDADKAKEFYTRFPSHPKAEAAKAKEKKLREDAASFGPIDGKTPERVRDPEFDAKLQAALEEVEAVKSLGPGAMARQYEDIGRKLAKSYPNREEPFMLMEFATRYSHPLKTLQIYKEIAAKAPAGEFKDKAAAESKARDVLNKVISLSGPAANGETIDLQKYRGKVVLLEFWATWCPSCVSLTGPLKALYEQFHDQGFEIIGINLDEDCADLEQFVRRHKTPWPQICDAGKNGGRLAYEFRARALPTFYLVDKQGKVRDLEPLSHMVEAIQYLLKEP